MFLQVILVEIEESAISFLLNYSRGVVSNP